MLGDEVYVSQQRRKTMNRAILLLSPMLFIMNINLTYALNITTHAATRAYVKQSEEYLKQVAYVKQNKYLQHVNSVFFKTELSCLTKNIYFEAGNQNTKGKLAVGLVTVNRIASDKFPDTICEVVKQKDNVRVNKRRWRWICQFSWFCDGKSDKPDIKSQEWKASKVLANTILGKENVPDITKGALYYHADYVNPFWRKKMIFIAKIYDHLFYKPEES